MDEFAEFIENVLPEDWSIYDPEMGSDCLLECPCGNVVEHDGVCPNGHVSPLREAGII
jgi:hypothetical protein